MGRKSADATGQIDDGQVEAVRFNPMVVSAQPAGSARSWLGSSHLPSNQNAQMPVFRPSRSRLSAVTLFMRLDAKPRSTGNRESGHELES